MPTSRTAAAGRQKGSQGRKTAATGKRGKKPDGTRTIGGKTWQERFLEKYAEIWTISGAASAIGISRRTVWNERQRNEDFALAFADAEERVTEQLESEAIRRSLDGSDRLLEFMLKSRRPEKYSEQHRLVHSGEITAKSVLTPEQVDEELAAFGMVSASAVAAGPDHVVAPPPEEEDDE